MLKNTESSERERERVGGGVVGGERKGGRRVKVSEKVLPRCLVPQAMLVVYDVVLTRCGEEQEKWLD